MSRLPLLVFLFAALGFFPAASAVEPAHTLSREVESILLHAKNATLYSLDPLVPGEETIDEKLEGFEVLGETKLGEKKAKAAVGAFRSSIAPWPRVVPERFYPRIALVIESGGRRYDFLLSYQCLQLYVYRDGVVIEELGVADLSDGGPVVPGWGVLQPMFDAAKIPLADEEPVASPELWKAEQTRWVAAMPKPILAIWKKRDARLPDDKSLFFQDLKPLRAALEKGIPDRNQRILALLAWFGSGRGPWDGFPSYEGVAGDLLLDYSTTEIVAAVRGAALTDAQIEGAARTLAESRGPRNSKRIPPPLKKMLLDHSLKSVEEVNRGMAVRAFQRG